MEPSPHPRVQVEAGAAAALQGASMEVDCSQ